MGQPAQIDGGVGRGGGGGFGGFGGGGNPGTPTGSIGAPFGENGGVLAINQFLFVPAQRLDNGATYIGIFDTTGFDDAIDGSSYQYRVEDLEMARYPTVRRIILTYRDLGPALIIVTVSGSNDNGQLVSASVTQSIGNSPPTGLLLTVFIDLQLTAFRPQLAIARAPGGGPISIVAAKMIGDIEEVTL